MQLKLAELMEDLSIGTVYHDYSGRGMYGLKTTGLVVDDLGTFMTALLDFSDMIQQAKEDGELDDSTTCLTWDQLGRRTIVY